MHVNVDMPNSLHIDVRIAIATRFQPQIDCIRWTSSLRAVDHGLSETPSFSLRGCLATSDISYLIAQF